MLKYLNKAEKLYKKYALLAYLRLVRRCYKKGLNLSEVDRKACDYCMSKIYELLEDVDDFIIT